MELFDMAKKKNRMIYLEHYVEKKTIENTNLEGNTKMIRNRQLKFIRYKKLWQGFVVMSKVGKIKMLELS